MSDGQIGGLYLDVGIDFAALAQQLGLSESIVAASAEKMANSYIKAQEKAQQAKLDLITGGGVSNFMSQAEADGFKAAEAIAFLRGEVNRLSAARQMAAKIQEDSSRREKEMMDRHLGDLQAAARLESEMLAARNKAAVRPEQGPLYNATAVNAQRISDALRPEQGPLYNEKAANAARLAEEAAYNAKREAIERDGAARAKEIQAQLNGDLFAAQRAADEARLAEAAALNKRINDALRPEQGPLNRLPSAGAVASPGQELIAFGSAASMIGNQITALGRATTFALTLPIAAGTAGMLHYSGIIEQAQASLARLLGSQNLASKMIDDLRKFSLTTPFKFEGSLEAFRKLIEMGFSAKEAIPTMRVLGDQVAALGGNADRLNDLVRVFGKIQQQGYVSGVEMRSFRNAAIPAFEDIREALGLTGAELDKQLHDKVLKSTVAIPILLAAMRHRSEGEMATMAQTMLGLWENVKEKVTFVLADLGKAFLPLAKQAERWAFDMLDGATNAAKGFAEMNPAVQNATFGFVAMLAALGPIEWIIGKIIKGAGGAASAIGYFQKILATSTGTSVLTGIAGTLEVLSGGAIAVGAAMTAWKLGEAVGDLGRLAAAVLNVNKQQDGWVAIMNTAIEKLTALSKFVLPDIVQKYFLQFGGKSKEADTDIERMRKTPFGGDGHMIADLTEQVRGGAGAKEAARDTFNKLGMGLGNDVMFKPEIINGRITTGAMASLNNESEVLRKRLNIDNDGGDDDGKARAKAFSELGLKDVKKDLAEIYAAFGLISGSLSDMQKGEALKKIEQELFLARKEGVLTQAVFDKLFSANRAKVTSDEMELGFSGPKTFQFPASMHTDWTTYNKDVADSKTKQDEAAAAVKKWNKVVLESNNLLHEKGMLEAGGGSANMAAAAWLADEEAVTTINGSLQKQIAVLESNNLAWTVNTTLQETWMQAVRTSLKPMEDMDKALAAFGIKNHTAELSRMAANWDGVVKAQHEGLIGIMDVKRAWVAMAEERLATGQKLSAADEKQYQQYKRQIDAVNLLKQSWKNFSNQVSTIVTDFGRGVLDILIPRNPEAKDDSFGVPQKIIDDFKSAYESLSAQGFADPKRALDEVIAKIKAAGSTAEANTIAMRNFGASGPEIARLLRDGSISAEQLAKTLDIATDSMEKNGAVSKEQLSKITQLWREVERSIGRALVETGAKAIATFVGVHMKSLMHSLGELLAKLPIIGSAMAKVFGVGGAAGGSMPNIPGGSSPIPTTPPVGLPPPPAVPSAPPSIPSGGGGSGGSSGGGGGVGGIAGGINMATGIVTAVSSVISNFQFAHMNTALGRIEESTRKTWIVTGEQGSESIQGLIKGIYLSNITANDRLIDVRSALFDPVAQDIEHLTDVLKAGGGGMAQGGSVVAGSTVNTTGDTYNIYIDSSLADVGDTDAAVEVIQSASRLLKAQGVTSRHRYSPGV